MIAQKGRPRAGIYGEGTVYVLFKHSKMLGFILKMCSGVKPSHSGFYTD